MPDKKHYRFATVSIIAFAALILLCFIVPYLGLTIMFTAIVAGVLAILLEIRWLIAEIAEENNWSFGNWGESDDDT